jgi:hypothetical protein
MRPVNHRAPTPSPGARARETHSDSGISPASGATWCGPWDEHQLRRVVDADGMEVFHVEELEDGEWFRFHQNGRTADVWTAGYYAEIFRIVTPQARTTFDYARSAEGKLPWLTSISSLATDGSSAIDVRITWDLSRPGNATRVERCAAGACTDVYPVP